MTASMRLTATVRCVACPWEETLRGDVCAIARVLAGAYARHLATQHPEQLAIALQRYEQGEAFAAPKVES